jgi:hypothetical protein
MERPASYGVVMTTNTKGGVMKRKGSRRLVARLGLALAVAAVAVPSAQAMTINLDSSGGSVRHYADDLHASLPMPTLPASNVRTDAASPQSPMPGSNVQTDSASVQSQPKPVAVLVDVQTDAASSVPLTDARHSALLKHQAQLGQQPAQLATAHLSPADSTGINWSVAGLGAALGMVGLMLLLGIVYYTGRHNRRGRLAAT